MRDWTSSLVAVFRRYERELVCGRCRGVIAWIRLRPFALVRITDRAGHPVNPLGGILATRMTQTRLSDAQDALRTGGGPLEDPAADVARYRRDLQYLHRAAGEVVYELTCATCGARYLRSLPHLTTTVRRSGSGRVVLR